MTRRIAAFFLMLVLLIGLVPGVNAAQAESGTEDELCVEAAVEESTAACTQTTQPSEPTEVESEVPDPEVLEADSISPMSIGSTQSGIMLFNYADNGNYTTVLNSQVVCAYKPNGSGTTRTAYIRNLGWHFARYGGVAYPDEPLYCIEPWRDFAASTSGNSVDRDVTLDGSGSTSGSNVWYAMPTARREAIGLILLYSDQMWDHSVSVTTTKKDNNPNVPLRIATQFLIYEIVCGLRDPVRFERNSTNECGTSGDVFYNAGAASVANFAPNYNSLVDAIQTAKKIPSFTSASSATAPTISLNGTYTTVTDANGVLSNWSFTDGNGAGFSKSGNRLTISQTGDISASTVFRASRSLPSAGSSSYNLWYMSGSGYQTTISLARASSGSLYAYFKLKAAPQTGSIALTKTTQDGQNLSGWRFGVYSDSACAKLVSGPHTTDSGGKLSVTGLSAGTYYVKELGHTDAAIDARYTCSSANPQKVTVTAGGTASVSFRNDLNTGSVKLVKTTNTGENLGGWHIGLYTDAGCAKPVSGSPFTTGADGTVTISGLLPGTYYARELPTGDPFWSYDTAMKAVTVTTGQTASVSFANTHYGRIQFRKTTNTGNHLSGWTFRLKDADGSLVGDYTTDEYGHAYTDNLPPGRYYVQELPIGDDYWSVTLGHHEVVVLAGQVVTDTWLNKEQGLAWVCKKTNTGGSVEGWRVTIYADEECTQEVGTLTTNAEGKAGLFLDPGTYWARETGDEHGRFEDEYWMVDESVQKFEVRPHEEVSITFTNVQYGRLKIAKALESGGSVEGWQFKITNAEGKILDGSPFATDEDGIILTGNLLPGTYTVEELLPEDSLYECAGENPQTVEVTQGQTAEVSFANTLRPGKITVQKVDITGSPLAGATFLLEWSEDGEVWDPVAYSPTIVRGGCSAPDVTDGCLTTGADGILEWDGLHPSLEYRLTEAKAPEGYKLLTKPAYEGTLPADELAVALRVTNARTFTMPETGASTGPVFRILSMVAAIGCIAMLLFQKKLAKWK